MSNDNELAKISIQRNMENAEREIASITDALTEQRLKRDKFVRALELKEKMHSKAMELFIRVHNDWAYQVDPDYVEWQKELSHIEYELDVMKNQNTLNQIDGNLKVYEEQIETQKKNVEESKVKLAALDE